MINNKQVSVKNAIAKTINEYLEYVDGYKINLIATYFELTINDKYDYGATLDSILYFCSDSLMNSIAVLDFINNDYKYGV